MSTDHVVEGRAGSAVPRSRSELDPRGRIIDLRDGVPPTSHDELHEPAEQRVPGRSRPRSLAARRRRTRLMTTPTLLLAADVLAWGAAVLLVARGPWQAAVAMLVGVLAVHAGTRGYQARLTFSALDQLPRLTLAAAAGALGMLVAVTAVEPTIALGDLVLRALVLWAALAIARSAAVALVKSARRRGLVGHRAVVIGGGEVGQDLVKRLTEHGELGLRPVGVLDPNPSRLDDLGVPWLGGIERLPRVVLERDVDVLVVAFSQLRDADMIELLRTCDRLEVEFFFVPRLFELQNISGDMDEAWGLPLLRVRRAPFRTLGWKVKRAFDIAVAVVLLALAAPVMTAVALAVRSEGGKGVLFRQQRIGLDGRPFTMLKFRSLRPVDDTESQTLWNVSNDDRMGRVGKVIRATSLDELPQLFNVLRGDMSLVGPRPERPHFVDEFSDRIPRYTGRHRVPAGLTGLAAVYGLRGDTSIEDRARIDNYYIENWSLWLDLKVLLRTVVAVFRRTGS